MGCERVGPGDVSNLTWVHGFMPDLLRSRIRDGSWNWRDRKRPLRLGGVLLPVSKLAGVTHAGSFVRGESRWSGNRSRADDKGTFHEMLLASAHEHSNANQPANLQDLTVVAQRALWQGNVTRPQRPEVLFFGIPWHASFEEMDANILVSFAFRLPEHRSFHCRDEGLVNRINLVVKTHHFPRSVNGWFVVNLDA